MLVKLIHTINIICPNFWAINPHVVKGYEFIRCSSEESKKQFAVLCDLIKILLSSNLIEVKNNKISFDGKIFDEFNIHSLIHLINSRKMEDLFISKYLVSKLDSFIISQSLKNLDLEAFRLNYE